MRSTLLLVLAAAAAVATPAAATPQEHPAPECGAAPAALPPELAGWTGRAPAVSSVDEAGLDGAAIGIGRGVDAALHKTATLHYVLRPEKPGGSVSYGGLFAFTAAEPGTYRVALGSPAWVDVLSEGKAVTSSAHGHGPDCSGIAKMVDFPLSAGRHVLQLAASGQPSIAVLVVKLP